MSILNKVRACFANARKDEEKGKKHKGLLVAGPNHENALEYIKKAKENMEWCEKYKKGGADYKLAEEWFYTIYYCALSILSEFGIESRNQKCTALFLRYAKDSDLITLDDDFIDRITVNSEKEKKTDVDEREEARYGPAVKDSEVAAKYDYMMERCKTCIAQTEELVFSRKEFRLPEELTK
ncbi:hypothetical protein J4470_03465 [Candidatus Woesearchaeota archaeon]|nr:hypothetical protein [Candidatus Woesearchaeota archaeon]